MGDGAAGIVDASAERYDALPDSEIPLPKCRWTAGGVYTLTEPPSDKGLHSVAVTEQKVLVAWQVTNPDPPNDNTRRLQRITFLGAPDGDAVALFPPPGQMTSYGGVQVAAGPDNFGATVWDEVHGCIFRGIDAAGTVLDGPRWVTDTSCATLRSTSSGFSLLTWDSASRQHRVLRLDPDGTLAHESQPIPALQGDVFWWSSVQLAGEDLMVAGMKGGLDPSEIQMQRLDADGSPRAEQVTTTSLGASSSRVRLILADAGLMLAWMETEEGGPSHQHQRLLLAPCDLSGRIAGPVTRLVDRYAYRDAGWSLTRFRDQILAAFVEPLESDSYGDITAVMVQPLTLQGDPDGEPVELSRERFARDPLIRKTPLGAVVVYTAYPDGLPHQIYAGAVLSKEEQR